MGIEISLAGQAAIVTGAGAGIVVSDRDAATAEATAAAIREAGGEALALPCDVTEEAALAALVGQAITRFGRLDTLVNNAGGGGPKPFDMPMADFEWAYRLNVYSVFRLCQLAAPHRQEAGGGEPPHAQHRLRPRAQGHPRECHRPRRDQDAGAGPRAGAHVMIADLDGAKAAATAATIAAETGQDVRGMACDVTREGDIQALVAATVAAFGGISMLVNNVGWGGVNADPLAVTETQMLDSYKLNTISAYSMTAAVRLCRAVLPGMQQRRWGRIINVLNIGAKAPLATSTPTSVSRAAGMPLNEKLNLLGVAGLAQPGEAIRAAGGGGANWTMLQAQLFWTF
ncbi:SDR family NAD(P)-dependent oxidoreductase [Sediminicoccus sp. BL-A-41-H5]|uniref:SDR family NAD(P)-dependent oxidoreductase n=1 Tax=Sediminicoccus sp. BL-A-41-H5 TaxID=3421106 RepID=UPI003D66E395